MPARRTSTRRIVVKGPGARKEAWEKKQTRTSRPKKKTSRKAPKRKTSKAATPRKAPTKRRTSRKPAKDIAVPLPTKTKAQEQKSTTYTEQRAIADAHRLLAEYDTPGYTVQFSNRLTRALGNVNHRTKIIKFSRPLFDRASATQRREVVIHEVAHAVVAHHHGRRPGVSHGKEWKDQMKRMGIKSPSRTHTVDRTGLRRQRKDTINVKCCGQTYRITAKRAQRFFEGIKAFRAQCKCPGGHLDEMRFATKADEAAYKRLAKPLLRRNVAICCAGR